MGLNMSTTHSSVDSRLDELQLVKETGFTLKKIQALHKRFHKLDIDNIGSLRRDQLSNIGYLSRNPLCDQILDGVMCGSETINFHQYLMALVSFQKRVNEETKLRMLFRLNDQDGDGFINGYDVFCLLSKLHGGCNGAMILRLTERVMAEADTNNKGKLNFDDFKTVCHAHEEELLQRMDIHGLH